MRTEYLEYLLEVAHADSISAAAKKLFIGQTTLSAIINSIEKELNVTLFLRTHKGIKLTAQGEQVIALAESIVEKNRQLTNLFSDKRAYSLRKKVALVAYPGACTILSLYLTHKLQKQGEDLSLHMQESVSTKIVSNVVNGMANIGIGSSAKFEFFNERYLAHKNGFVFESLYKDHFYLCVNKKSAFAQRKAVDISELEREHLAVTQSHPGSSSSSVGAVFKYIAQFSVFNNAEVVKKAVLFNDMISIMPRLSYYEDPYVAFGDLILIPLTGFETELTNFLVLNERIGLSAQEEEVIRLIRNFYQAVKPEPVV